MVPPFRLGSWIEADARCRSIGARLCTYTEIQRGGTEGPGTGGCKIRAAGSHCWLNTTDTKAKCGEFMSYVSRCGADKGRDSSRVCAPLDFLGSVKCCADNTGSDPLLPQNEDEMQDRAKDCDRAICGADCAAIDGCGWSSTRMKCVAGKQTSKREMMMGDCESSEGHSIPALDCRKYTCGSTCAAVEGCGWSGTRRACVAGGKTNQREMKEGDCPDVPRTAKECKRFRCGDACAAADGCGWSSTRMKCVLGGKTNKHELAMCASETTRGTRAPGTSDAATSGAAIETAIPTASSTKKTTIPKVEVCESLPLGWKDSEKDSCEKYAAEGWCTADGSYGPNWGSSGDTFATYADHDGNDAARACCECGGGSRRMVVVDTLVTNVPTPAAVDCAGTWGEFGACSVACGGGTRHRFFEVIVDGSNGGAQCPQSPEYEACNIAPCTTPASTAATTGSSSCHGSATAYPQKWGVACACARDSTCDGSSCLRSGDGTAFWDAKQCSDCRCSEPATTTAAATTTTTTVELRSCDSSSSPTKQDWGVACVCPAGAACAGSDCRYQDGHGFWDLDSCFDCSCADVVTDTTPAPECMDASQWWSDSAGDTCERYESEKWCEDGGYGSRWGEDDTFAAYINFDLSADQACCICGGG